MSLRAVIAAAVAVATLGALAAQAAPDWGAPGTESAAASECAWQRHSKRIVKHVRRDGRWRRVVRRRNWWSCDSVAAPAPATPPAAAPGAPASPPAAEPQPELAPNRLGVKAAEYSYVLSRPSVAPGEVVVELSNMGEDAHNLNLQREGSEEPALQIPETASQQRQSERFELPAGTYRLWCSLPTHDEQGMHATLVVGEGG